MQQEKNSVVKIDPSFPPLNDVETKEAFTVLNKDKKFREVIRRFEDPPVDLQRIGLFSFVPARGSVPNEKGIYGYAKLSGNYSNEAEANLKARFLITNVDSFHQIFHPYVGRYFPVTVSSEFSKEVDRVDLNKEMTQDISEDVKKKREKEEKDISEIKQREQALLTETKYKETHPDDPELILDEYITMRVKKAQLTWTYLETEKKMGEMVDSLASTQLSIEDMEEKHPENRERYFQKYMDARKQSGLDVESKKDNFIKFMVDDVEIPAVKEKYEQLKKSVVTEGANIEKKQE